MTKQTSDIQHWLQSISDLIHHNAPITARHYNYFIQHPNVAVTLVDIIAAQDEFDIDDENPYFSACIFALEISVAQLQNASDAKHKPAQKTLQQLMARMTHHIQHGGRSLHFWLPVLNAFYEIHVELTEELKDAYFELASLEELPSDIIEESNAQLASIKALLSELSDLSIYDIAANLFSQSYAMPAEFFADLVTDLFDIKEGQDIAILFLLHPQYDVRDVVVETFNIIIHQTVLSPDSLSRLQAIKKWYPNNQQPQFDYWIKEQRKQGAVFRKEHTPASIDLKASEIDGSGAQGIFIHYRQKQINRLSGLLVKIDYGIKDAWFTPAVTTEEVDNYYTDSFDNTIMLRPIDDTYLQKITNHFLAISLERGEMPDLHLLEIQEALNITFIPEKLDIHYLLETLLIEITPFTQARIDTALKRTKTWSQKKQFTESWYIENAHVDKVVNQFSSIIDGVKVCNTEKATQAVFHEIFEPQRAFWLFHFIWVALWLKAKSRANEKTWEDAFIIAHLIHTDLPLSEIPIMQEISRQTIANSIETMQERRTHLSLDKHKK